MRTWALHTSSPCFVTGTSLLFGNTLVRRPLSRCKRACSVRSGVAPQALAGRGRKRSRRKGRGRSGFELEEDRVEDQTDITTYVSCGVCYNSIMVNPERLYPNGMRLRCNVCEKYFLASLGMLENVDGTPFDTIRFIQMKEMQDRAASGEAA